MQQSNVIFAVIFFAFVIFVTIRGELPAYLAIFFGSGGGGGNASPAAKPAPEQGAVKSKDPAATPQSSSGLPTFQ